jgi:branched-chain amino acid transport system permease protein
VGEFLQHFVNGLSLGSCYALIAVGYSMVYGILQLINFAHGEVVMLGAVFAFAITKKLSDAALIPSWTVFFGVLAASMVLCSLLGFLIERLAYRPIRRSPRMNALITAIGVSLFLQYFTQLDFMFGAIPQPFPELVARQTAFEILGVSISNLQILILGLTIVFMGVLQWIVYKTKLGKGMRAVSENTEVSAMLGIPVNRVISFTFIIGSILAAAAGIFVCLMYPRVDALMGSMLGLKAFVAAVLGGIGSLPGAVLGGIVMGLAESMAVGYLSSTYRDAIAFAILILVLLIRPSGLLGRAKVEKV